MRLALSSLSNALTPSLPAAERKKYAVRRGAGGGALVFEARTPAERKPPDGPAALWSPAGRVALEAKVPAGLFESAPQQAEDLILPQQEPKPSPAGSKCLVCLEPVGAQRLECSQCTMVAHVPCLAKWFASDACPPPSAAANPLNRLVGGLPRSHQSCPQCRSVLDWDALALQARRRRASGRRRQQDEMRHQFERECEFAQECE